MGPQTGRPLIQEIRRRLDLSISSLVWRFLMSYVLNTVEDRQAMLKQIGASSVAELFRPIPDAIQLKRPLAVPPALTEIELTQHVQALANRNQAAGDAICFLGGGSYDHFVPAVV